MMLLKQLWVLFFILSFGIIMSQSDMMKEFNGSVGELTNCTLKLETKSQQLKLDYLIDQENWLIKLDITIKWSQRSSNDTYPETLTWFFTNGNIGKKLLALDPNFVGMSLLTLSYGIEEMKLSLLQTPDDCLGNMPASYANKHLIYALLTLHDTSTAFKEEGKNMLGVCTGSEESDISCCEITPLEKKVKCKGLLDDSWIGKCYNIVVILTFLALTHVINYIPMSIFDDSEKQTYHILGDILKLKVKLMKGCFNEDAYTEIDNLKHGKFLKSVHESIEKNIHKVVSNRMQQHVTEVHVSGTVNITAVDKANVDLIPAFYPSMHVLESLFILLKELFKGCFVSHHSVKDFKILAVIFKVFVVLLCTSPIIFRAYLINFYHDNYVTKQYLNYVFVSLIILLTLLIPKEEIIFFCQVVKHVQQYDINENIEKLCSFILLPLRKFKNKMCKWCLFLIFNLLITPFFFLYLSLPLLQFSIEYLFNFPKLPRKGKCLSLKIICRILILVTMYIGLFVLIDSFAFYTQCCVYILIGLLLNYEMIFDKIIFILLILTYALDCVSTIHKKVHCFNVKVVKLVDQINKEITGKSCFDIALNNGNLNRNIVIQVPMSYHNEHALKVAVRSDGKPCLLVHGLFIFNSFENQENLPITHIPRQFVDKLASIKGRFTAETKHVLIVKAVIEITVMILGLLMLFFVLHGFMRGNNVSAITHTIVSIGSSTALVMLNKLLFKAADPTFDDHDMHLKEIIKAQIPKFQDSWEDIDFGEISLCGPENIDLSTNNSCNSDLDFGLFAKVLSDYPGIVESFFCKKQSEKTDESESVV